MPGTKAGLAKLEEFCSKKLKQFVTNRNDPTTDNLSGLSPWLHFGEFNVGLECSYHRFYWPNVILS